MHTWLASAWSLTCRLTCRFAKFGAVAAFTLLGAASALADEAGGEANFRVMLANRPVLIRAKRIWQTPGTLQGKPVWRYGYSFTGISADDWDAVVRFCNNDAVVAENKAQQELEVVRLQADDVARLIPKKLQDQLLALAFLL